MNAHDFSTANATAFLRAHELRKSAEAAEDGMESFLYSHWYAAPSTTVSLDPVWPPLEGMLCVAQDEALGWKQAVVTRMGVSGVVVARDSAGRQRALMRGTYAHGKGDARTGLPALVGDNLVTIPRSGGVVSQGWWRTWGGGWDPRLVPANAIRVYLAPRISELVDLVGSLTSTLEAQGAAWMMKVAAHAEHLGRADAVVVYLHERTAVDVVQRCATSRVRAVPGPPLTAPLMPGVSWAEDPGDGKSFGETRCALVAAALKGAIANDGGTFLRMCHEVFHAAGVDPAAPHLRGGTSG